jgi:hypothetical protein
MENTDTQKTCEPPSPGSPVPRLVRHALQQVLDYRHGKGRFNLSHLNFYERDNAAHDLWQEVEDEIRQAIQIIETNAELRDRSGSGTPPQNQPS